MSTHKHFDKICYTVLAITLVITVLFMNGKALGIPVIANGDSESDMFTANDLNADWDSSNASEIILSDSGSTVNGNGAYIYENNVCIASAGKYILSGNLSDASIIINADANDKIWLLFNNVSIHCNDYAAVQIEQADKVFLTLADGTENTLSSGAEYNSDAVSSGIDGTIYSRDDLTINGSGALNVTAEYQHGIVCNDDLVITGGSINVEAVQDGLHANDSIRIKDSDITVSAGDDGITVSNDDETAYLYVESGNINILSCYEGLEAIDVTIAGGTINIVSTDDGINANGSGQSAVIKITGGNITITNSDGRDADGLDSNKDIYIRGGNILISVSDNGNSAIDYGTENGGVCEISGGTVLACGSSGMAEGFDASSTQGFIMYTTSAAAGTTVSVANSNGSELLSEEIPYSFSSVVVSTPEMNIGDTCILTIGETKEEITIDNTAVSSGFAPGNKPMENMQNDNISKDINSDSNSIPANNAENTENASNSNETPADMPTPPNGENGTPPEKPDDSSFENGEQPPEMPSEETDANNSQPDFSQDNDNLNEKPNNGNPDEENNNTSDSSQENNSLNKENIIYCSVSLGILIIGCIIAFAFKKRK